MPFDGTNGPFRERRGDRRPGPSGVQRALRGWRPIEYCERTQRWTCKAAALLRRLRCTRCGAVGRPR